jgi:N-sulfoglucosamine sulfohydrolase
VSQRPNVLWITTHDINPHLGAYAGVWPGAEDAVTPNLDRLATEGVRYDNAFATAPVCAPSRSSILTGMYPTSIGTMHHRTSAVPPPEVSLLPEYFRAAGYYTTNNFLTDVQVVVPPTTFDECGFEAHWRNRPHPDTPFFAAFHGIITHESQLYVTDEQFAANTPHVHDVDRHDPATVKLPPYYPESPAFRIAWARYLDLITEMDHSVGELLQQLEDDGLTASTIVVFWSDHGMGMPRAKRWPNEAGLREPLLVRWPGHLPPGTVRRELVSLMDLAPTMLAMCGLAVPAHMQAVPIIDHDGSMTDRPHDYVFAARDRMDEQEDTSRTVRDQRFRYIRHVHPDRSPMQYCEYPENFSTWRDLRAQCAAEALQVSLGEVKDRLTPLQRTIVSASKPVEELYDIVADPHEEQNLADDPAFAETVTRLSDALSEWMNDVGDIGVVAEDELLEQWRPGGRPQVTAEPEVALVDGSIVATCATPGSSIGWTMLPPSDAPEDAMLGGFARVVGFEDDGRRWQLCAGPFAPPASGHVFFRGFRLGFEPSSEIVVAGDESRSAG